MTTEPFAIDSLTLTEIEAIEEVIGTGFSQAGEDGSLRLPYAIYWIAGRRDDPGLAWETVKELPMSTITSMVTEESPLESGEGGSS